MAAATVVSPRMSPHPPTPRLPRKATRAWALTLRSTVRFAGTAPVDDGCPLHTEHPWAGVDTPDAELLGANGSVSRVELGGGVDAVCDLVAELAGLKDADAGSQ